MGQPPITVNLSGDRYAVFHFSGGSCWVVAYQRDADDEFRAAEETFSDGIPALYGRMLVDHTLAGGELFDFIPYIPAQPLSEPIDWVGPDVSTGFGASSAGLADFEEKEPPFGGTVIDRPFPDFHMSHPMRVMFGSGDDLPVPHNVMRLLFGTKA